MQPKHFEYDRQGEIRKIAEDFLMKMTSQQERRFAEIVDNHNSSDSLKLLAKEFNLTKNSVKIVYKKLLADGRIRDKLHNKWSDREIDTIRKMINAGHSISEVSITLGKHESSIRKKLGNCLVASLLLTYLVKNGEE